MEKEDNLWDDISFVTRGKHRELLLKMLDKPKTPAQVKESTGLHFNTVSRSLVELENKGLIKCLNPSQKLARFYQITKRGEMILKNIKMNQQ